MVYGEHLSLIRGLAEWTTRARDGKSLGLRQRGANAIQYEGLDALGRLLAGDLSGRISAMYFKFFVGPSAPGQEDEGHGHRAKDFRELGENYDFVRVPLNNGLLTASAAEYSSNRIIFTGIAATGSTGENRSLAMDADSWITLAALVVAPVWADKTQDRVWAVHAPNPFNPPAGLAVGLQWAVQLAVPEP